MEQPIRILHVLTIMNLGGIETFLMTLYRNIDKSKIQFDFLVHRNEKGVFDDEIKMLGGEIHYIEPLKPKKTISYYNNLTLFFKNNRKYDIVHSHLNANSTLVLSVAKKCGVKQRIAHAHIDQAGGSYSFIKKFLKIGINKMSTKRFACSEQAGKWLFKNAEFDVFNNSIDSNLFTYNSNNRKKLQVDLNLSEETIVIGHIGRFNEQKNHVFIIEVFYFYLKRNPNSRLLLIGDGNLMQNVKEKAIEKDIIDKIIFTGAISNANEYFNIMDLFLFPSLYEGLGIVAVEAQCNGLPVLMTDTLPQDVEITDLITRLSLRTSAEEWAQMISVIIDKNNNREGYDKQIIDNGYDIHENVKLLTEYYLSLK